MLFSQSSKYRMQRSVLIKKKTKNSSCLVNQTALNTWNCNPTDKAKRSHVEGSDLSPKMITSY